MARHRIIYGGLFCAAVCFSTLYSYRGLRFCIAIMVLISLAGALQAIYGRCVGRAFIDMQEQTLGREEEGVLRLCFENRGFLPIAFVCVLLEWEAPGEMPIMSRNWLHAVPSRGTADMELVIQAKHCGRAAVRLKKVRIYDYLGLGAINGRDREEKGIYIMPAVRNLKLEEMRSSGLGAPGMDKEQQEGYEIRSYQAGDSIHRIHWKLTARTDELQIRDFEGGQTDSGELYLILGRLERNEKGAQIWDSYLELAAGVMLCLYRCGRLGRVVWPAAGRRFEQSVNREEDILDCMYCLLALDVTQMGGGMMPEDALHLDMDLRVYKGAQYIYG